MHRENATALAPPEEEDAPGEAEPAPATPVPEEVPLQAAVSRVAVTSAVTTRPLPRRRGWDRGI
jgi:hypothetical protein